jgi:transposase, IS5 family
VGIDLGREPVPDETTVCKFRHLLEAHGLASALFDAVTEHLRAHGVAVSTGTIVDATIIAAPSSTKNAPGTRDPAMHQTRKGQQWSFGMKGHFGVDSQSKLIHSVEVTPANIHDSHVLPWLLYGEERRVWGDSAYAGQGGVLSVCAPHARDFIHRQATTPEERATNRWKSHIRARVEHPIGVIKRVFGFTKVCCRGLVKNRHRLVIKGVMLVARSISLVAHVHEEMTRERSWRASSGEAITQPLDLELQRPEFYDGPPDRPFPDNRRRARSVSSS